MRQVIVNMKDFVFADAVAQALRSDSGSDFAVQNISRPGEILRYCNILSAYALLMEVTRYGPYTLDERLGIGNAVKRAVPTCKVVLLVDENSEKELAKQVRRAKKEGLIDQFIYGSTSASFLVAMMDAL